MRGGTSKGVFIRRDDFPGWDDAATRDRTILAIMGSPDPMQIDGLGGTHSSTSKLVVVGPGTADGVDLDYTFVQVGVDAPVVDLRGNCGNLTAAVAPFGIFESMVRAHAPVARVMLWNSNTGKRILAEVPFDGSVVERGSYLMDGVPTPGAPLVIRFLDPAGSATGRLFPSGRTRDRLTTSRGDVEISIVDVTNPVVFVGARSLGLKGTELPAVLNADAGLLQHLEEIRRKAAVLAGVHADEERAGRSNVPSISLVSEPQDYVTAAGRSMVASDLDLVGRIVSMRRIHHAYQGTGAMCTAAAIRLAGTIPYELANGGRGREDVVIGHPKGTVSAEVSVERTPSGDEKIAMISVLRTSRRLMRGTVFAYC